MGTRNLSRGYGNLPHSEVSRPTTVSLLETIKPHSRMMDFKEIYLRQLNFFKTLTYNSTVGIPTINDALFYLGQAHTRVEILEDMHKMLQYILVKSSSVWPQELWDLREMSRKQVALCTQAVKAFLYKANKTQQESYKIPTIKDIDWKG
jgi:hypothetical protein